MSDDEDDGQEIRDFSFVFETHCEITKAWKKEVGSKQSQRRILVVHLRHLLRYMTGLSPQVQDTRFIKFLLSAGKPRAYDMFHRLDKDQGGTLTLREFVFGMNENPTLPSAISLDDLWKFARQFDGDGDGTIDANEYRDFIDNLKPIHEPKHTHFQCVFPDTFCMSEGQFTHWFSQGHDNTFSTRGLPDKVKPMCVSCFAPKILCSQDDARTHVLF